MNTLYLRITHASGFIEEINRNEYLNFDCTDGNQELLKKNTMTFLMELAMKSKKYAVMSAILKKIT